MEISIWNISEAMEWIKLSLLGMLFIVIPILYLIKKNELAKKENKEAEAKRKAEEEREAMMEFYRAGSQLCKMEIEKNKK